MTSDEALARLRALKYSHVRGKRLGLSFVASRAGCTVQTLYNAINSGKVSPTICLGLARAFDEIKIAEKDNAVAPRYALLRSMFTPAELAKLPRS